MRAEPHPLKVSLGDTEAVGGDMTTEFIIGENVFVNIGGTRIHCMVRALRDDGMINVIERFPRVHDVESSAISKITKIADIV